MVANVNLKVICHMECLGTPGIRLVPTESLVVFALNPLDYQSNA